MEIERDIHSAGHREIHGHACIRTYRQTGVHRYKKLTSSDNMSGEKIKNIYNDCKETLKMVNLAKDYFMDASMLEIDDSSVGQTESAINDMKRLRKNIKDVYLLSIEKIAKDKMQDLNAIDLNGAINMVKGSAVSMGMEVVN